MKAFFERYSYDSVRMLLNQIAIAIFGFSLALATGKASVDAEQTGGNDTLLTITSIAAILFYLALEYGVAWKMGSNDRIGIQYGKIAWRPLTGLKVSLLANSVNILLAILITVGVLGNIPDLPGVVSTIALLAQGMYQGVLAVFQINGLPLHEFWWVYFVIILPALLISTVGYITGAKDFHITNMGIPELPESDRPTKAERKAAKKDKES